MCVCVWHVPAAPLQCANGLAEETRTPTQHPLPCKHTHKHACRRFICTNRIMRPAGGALHSGSLQSPQTLSGVGRSQLGLLSPDLCLLSWEYKTASLTARPSARTHTHTHTCAHAHTFCSLSRPGSRRVSPSPAAMGEF